MKDTIIEQLLSKAEDAEYEENELLVKQCLEEALSHDSQLVDVRTWYSEVLLGLGDDAQAAQELSVVLQQDPDYVDGLHLLGQILLKAGGYDQAGILLKRASGQADGIHNPWIWYHLGQAYLGQNREADAQVAFNESRKLDFDHEVWD